MSAVFKILVFVVVVFFGCRKAEEITVVSTDPGIIHLHDKLQYQGTLFSGYLLTKNNGGDTQKLDHFVEGLNEGTCKKWYDNGQLRETGQYHHGKKTGEHLGFWLDGTPRFVYHFNLDLPDGNQKDWTDQGIMIRDFNYKNGNEEGIQKMWNESGKIKMNYVVKNGRKYGLQDGKNCDTLQKEKP